MNNQKNVTQKLIESHLISGDMKPGEEIGLKIDQTLTQDATGTMVMLEFEAMNIPRVRTELSAQYVDHNLIQTDFKNPDDHLFLASACKKFGVHFSRPGNGVSHPVHMERFGKPGKSLLGSDSHTCAAGSMGMLAIGAGGLEVALAMAGEPFYVKMPKVMGVKLTGELPDWVSAKDIILEMLRRHDVDGGVGKIIEYYGPGLKELSAMDRHVIANMGAELGATTTVFPADENLKHFLQRQGREEDYSELAADEGAEYDEHDEINLSELEPLIAKPSSPGNVVPVKEVEVNGSRYEVEIEQEVKTSKTPKLVRSKAVPSSEYDKAKTSKPTEKKGAGAIKAPLPGTILEMKVKVGDVVKSGDLLLVMEAMKMENNITADKEGKVSAINVNNGDSVMEGDVLVEIGG